LLLQLFLYLLIVDVIFHGCMYAFVPTFNKSTLIY
jgi:hypothetical protein